MDTEDDFEDHDFPSCEMPQKLKKSITKKKQLLSLSIIIIVIILGLIIFLIVFFSKKKISINSTLDAADDEDKEDNESINNYNDGGYIIGKYYVQSRNNITLFEPSSIGLSEKEFRIEKIENNIRILQENEGNIENNIFYSNFKGEIKFKIILNKTLSNMNGMFQNCKELKDLDLSNFKSEKVEDMSSTFLNCDSLENINFNGFNSSKLINMDRTFEGCKELTGLDLSSFEVPQLKSMKSTFKNCNNIFIIKLDNFNFKDIVYDDIFSGDNNLKIVIFNNTKSKLFNNQNYSDNINIDCIKGEKEKCKKCDNFKCESCNDGYYLPDILFPIKCKINGNYDATDIEISTSNLISDTINK